jgi:hypothetical protein
MADNTDTKTPETTETQRGPEVSENDIRHAEKLTKDAGGKKSPVMRQLADEGWSTGKIAKALTAVHYPNGDKQVRFQHVYNVLNGRKPKGS